MDMIFSITYASCIDNDLHCENFVTSNEEKANCVKNEHINDIMDNNDVSMKSKTYDSDGNEKIVFISEYGNTYIIEVKVYDI